MSGKYNYKSRPEASLTIEASLSLTVFMLMVFLLMMPMKLLDTQRRVQLVLESAAKDLSQYAYIRYRSLQGETGLEGKNPEEAGEEALQFLEQAGITVLLMNRIRKAAGDGRVEDLNFGGTSISVDGEWVDLQVKYKLRLHFSLFRLDSVPAAARCFRRGWIGSEGDRQALGRDTGAEDETMVYIGKNMGRYHWFPDCHYISNDIAAVSYAAVGDKLSVSGTHYKPCSVCGKGSGAGDTVYILPNGSYYHGRRNCSSLTSYVKTVPLSEVAHLGECSYCRRMKEGT